MNGTAGAEEYLRRAGVSHAVNEVARKEVRRVRLKGKSRYQFCPDCLRMARKAGDTQDVKPLWSVTWLVRGAGNMGRVVFDYGYECDTCGRTLTADDIARAYIDTGTKEARYKNEFELTDENMARYGFVTAEKKNAEFAF